MDILRAFAAISVVIFHFGLWSWPINIESVQSFFRISNIFVGFFFLLSGFILVYVNKENFEIYKFKVKDFYKKRILRIFPVYFISLIATIFFLKFTNQVVYLKDIILQFLFLQSWVPGHSLMINFVAWSLSVEVFFYLLFPILFFFLIKKTKIFFSVSLIFWLVTNIFTIFSAFNFDQNQILIREFTKFFPLFHLSTFMFGMFFAKLFVEENYFIKKIKSSWLFFLSIAFLIVYSLIIPVEMRIAHHNGLLLPIFILLMFGVLNLKGFSKKIFTNKTFQILGKASYGIYIYQVIIYYLVYWLYKKIGIFELLKEEGRFYFYLFVLLLISVYSYYFFESKIVRYFRKS